MLPLMKKLIDRPCAALPLGFLLAIVACFNTAQADTVSAVASETVNYLISEGRSKPLQIVENGDSEGGIISDMVTAIFSDSPWTITPRVMPINRLRQSVARREINHWIAYDSMHWRTFGNEGLVVEEPLYKTRHVLLTCRTDLPDRIQRIEQLRGLKLVTIRHFDYPEVKQAARAGILQQVPVDRYQAGIELVRMGRADGFVEMASRLQYHVASTENANCLRWVNFSDVIPDFSLHMVVSVDWPKAFRDFISKRLRELQETGELDAITARYQQVDR